MAARSSVFSFALAALLLLCACPPAESRRTLFTGKTLPSSRFGAAYEVRDPATGSTSTERDYPLYFQYVAEIAGLIIVIGVLHLLFIFAYIIWRLCRCCICKPKKDGFSPKCVVALKVGLLAGAAALVIVAILSASFTAVLFKGIDGVTKNLLKHGRSLVRDVDVAAQRILAQERTSGKGADIQDAVDAGNDILKNVEDFDKTKTSYVDKYRLALYILVWVPVGLFAMSAALTLFSISACGILRIIGVFSFLPSCVILVVCGIQVLLWIVLTDGCKEIDPAKSTDTVKDAIGCSGGSNDTDSSFGSFRNVVGDALDDAAAAGCTAVVELCANRGPCDKTCTPGNMVTFPNETVTDGGELLISQCVLACTQPRDRELASIIVKSSGEISNFTEILAENIDPLLECTFLDSITNDLYSDLCKSTTTGLFGVTVVLFIIILIADVSAVALFYASQRVGKTGAIAASPEYEYEYEYADDAAAKNHSGAPMSGDCDGYEYSDEETKK